MITLPQVGDIWVSNAWCDSGQRVYRILETYRNTRGQSGYRRCYLMGCEMVRYQYRLSSGLVVERTYPSRKFVTKAVNSSDTTRKLAVRPI